MIIRASKSLNKKGFSLIELMVVVAIIGILAAIGIPQYSKFQAKARQSEAKGALSALYTSEISFNSEWNLYTVDLKNIGFGVSGQRLRYVTGFPSGAACTAYSTAGGAPAEVNAATNTWSDGTNVNVGGVATFAAVFTKVTPAATVALGSCVATVGALTFTALSIGDPNANLTAAPVDGWTINQLKLISNTDPGIL